MIRVALSGDVRLYLESLAEELNRQPGIEVVATARGAAELAAQVPQVGPDIVVVDMSSPGAVSTVRALARTSDGACVVGIAVPETEHHIVDYLAAGVSGYVVREGSVADFVTTIRAAARGELVCKPRIAALLRERIASLVRQGAYLHHGASLTQREQEILELIDQGLSNKEIARRLKIKVATVKNHVHSILEKLNVHRRGQAAALMHGRATPSAPQGRSMRSRK